MGKNYVVNSGGVINLMHLFIYSLTLFNFEKKR